MNLKRTRNFLENEIDKDIMSTKNDVNPPAPNPAPNSNFSLLSFLGKERLTGPNYMDWMRNLRFTLRYENKEYVLDVQISTINDDSIQEDIEAYQKQRQARNALMLLNPSWLAKLKPGASICAFVLEMKGYFHKLESLNMVFDVELSINIILSSLLADYNQFVLSYQMNMIETSIMKLHSFLQTVEQRIKKINVPSTSADPVLTVMHDKEFNKRKYSEEEEAEAMTETMEQYISKTRTDYGSGVARPKIKEKDSFELKGQFLKELQENTFSGLDNEDANEYIEKVLKFVDLFHVPNITVDQQCFDLPYILNRAASHAKKLNQLEVILFYNGLDVPTRQILDSKGAIPTKTTADAKKAIQEMAEYSQKWHNGTSRGRSTKTSDGLAAIQEQLNYLGREIKKVNEKVYAAQVGCRGYRATAAGFYQRNNANPSYQERRQSMEDTLSKFMGELAKRQEENSNLIKEIRALTDASIRNQGASIKTLEIQIGQMSKVLQERGFGSLPSSTKTNLRGQVKSISTTIDADSHSIRRIGSPQYAVPTGQNRTLMYETKQMTIPFPSYLNGYYCDGKKGSYGPQFLEAYSKASQIDESIPQKEKDPGSFTLPCFINNVCFNNALIDVGVSVSVMPLLTYFNLGLWELAHTKLTVELVDMTVKYPKGIAENVLVRIDHFLSTARAKIDLYKKKITLRVREERIIFKSVNPASSFIKRVYMLSLRERMELYLEARLIGETLVFIRSLDPLNRDYIKLNDLNEPFKLRRNQGDDLMLTLRKVRRFDGMITIYNGNDEVTYQMVRSHLRFKRHTNEQCNKILPLLKVSKKDEKNGILHAYQKLKEFYKGVLNLGPDYIQNAKTEEWLTRGHISVHEME
ncbi:hypothetical protein Tco_0569254 [Tanacetum coccineum]